MILFTMFIIEGCKAHRGVKTLFFIRFGTIFTSKVYIFKTLSTKIQTDHTCNAASHSFKT